MTGLLDSCRVRGSRNDSMTTRSMVTITSPSRSSPERYLPGNASRIRMAVSSHRGLQFLGRASPRTTHHRQRVASAEPILPTAGGRFPMTIQVDSPSLCLHNPYALEHASTEQQRSRQLGRFTVGGDGGEDNHPRGWSRRSGSAIQWDEEGLW